MHTKDTAAGADLVFFDCYGHPAGKDMGAYVGARVRQGMVSAGVNVSPGVARQWAAELIRAADEAERGAPACYKRGEVGEYGPACSRCPFAACETCAHWNGEVF